MHKYEVHSYKKQIKEIKKEIDGLAIPEKQKKYYLDKL